MQLSTFGFSVGPVKDHPKPVAPKEEMLGREGPWRGKICFLFFKAGKGSIWIQHVTTSSKTTEMLQGLLEDLKDESKGRG